MKRFHSFALLLALTLSCTTYQAYYYDDAYIANAIIGIWQSGAYKIRFDGTGKYSELNPDGTDKQSGVYQIKSGKIIVSRKGTSVAEYVFVNIEKSSLFLKKYHSFSKTYQDLEMGKK